MCNRPNPCQISLYFKCPVHNPHKHCQLNAACLRHWVIICRWALHLTCKLTSPRVFAHLPDQVFFKWHLHANSSISEAQSELETSCSRKGRVMRKGRRKHGNNGVVKLAKKTWGSFLSLFQWSPFYISHCFIPAQPYHVLRFCCCLFFVS